jgi:hypothetical protein
MDSNEKLFMQTKWVDIVLKDGNIFSGTVFANASYGMYVFIGGDNDRLNLFPWFQINRVIYKKESSDDI